MEQFLIYQSEDGRTKLDVRLEDQTVWLNQKQLTELFGKAKGTLSEHIKHIFEDAELEEDSVVRLFRTTATDGKQYEVAHYNLDMVLALGFRVRSPMAVRFRQWAADKLKEYIVKGFVLDDQRLKNPKVGNDYFEELTRRIQDIRTSERRFYQKITDIYATSIDYDNNHPLTQDFFATVQNKVHYAIHGQTAAEVIVSRADRRLPKMGLTHWEGARIRKSDAAIAKNYLNEEELHALNNLAEQYLIFAEGQAERRVAMTMQDWIVKLEGFLMLNDREILQLDVATASGVKRQELTVQDGDDLEQTAKRPIYADFRVGEINLAKGEEFMELRYPGGETYLALGQAHGDVDALAVQREMIRRTIREHLDKEKRLRPLAIKVLSLFFIDEVARYRSCDADGNAVKGEYARIFEEEYRRAAKLPAYQSLFAEIDLDCAAEEVHNGYFSIDKKGGWTDTAENNAGNRENAERAYNLIMKEKEKLLGFETALKFIFSHSALKEGWDNPNVFQICTLRDIQTERERRQTIGRGLRLCVNQQGDRVRGFEVNTLTVVATENYEQFAENLQKEIEADTGIRFGIAEPHQFAAIAVTTPDGQTVPLGIDQSKALWEHLKAAGHIDAKGKVQDSLKTALKDGTLTLPAEFEAQKEQIAEVLRKVSGRLEIKNADERKQVALRKGQDGKAITLSDEFKALWDRIKHQTTYRVQFDNSRLIADGITALQKAPAIAKARLQWRKADIAIGKAGVQATEKRGAATVVLDETDIELPDVLTDLQDRTQLTRRTITRILTGAKRLDDFKRNPQQFIELAAETINRCKRLALVDGIKYQKLGDQHVYAQELFEKEELTGYLKNMLMNTEKSIYQHVVYDSTTERDFADALEKNEAIKLYAKLPGWFKVPTPLGSYNPDWAVLVEEDGTQRLYFVVETKSSLFTDDLRDKESAKIECGKAHFHALAADGKTVGENPARYVVARSVDDLLADAAKA